MIVYKVINDNDFPVTEYYLQREKAQQSVRDMMAWFTESFRIETLVFEEAA